MGLFDGIKRNLNIGGPKVRNFDGPNVCSLGDESAPLSFVLVGGGEDAHVLTVKLQLRRERRDSSNARRTTTVREAIFDNQGAGWDIAADTEMPFKFELPLNTATQVKNADIAGHFQQQNPNLSDEQAAMAEKMMGGVGRFLQAASQADNMFHQDDRWTFKLIVDVDRVAMDPGAEIPTTVVAPGQVAFGTRAFR